MDSGGPPRPSQYDNDRVIRVLLSEIYMQLKMRLEDMECGGDDIDESFNILKARLSSTLIKKGMKDSQLLDQINRF